MKKVTVEETELQEYERTQLIEEIAEYDMDNVDTESLLEMYRQKVFDSLFNKTDDELVQMYLKRFKSLPFFS